MKTLIINSNWRARVALQVLKICGRSPELMAELRDALRQRLNIRECAHYSLWYAQNLSVLKMRFAWFCARHPFRCVQGSDETEFEKYCIAEYERR